ncbi:Eco57I restriction-modification methylase domain-containing protein [Clostridium sp.]|uniref:Eco57I restriction-modification methylase domain-containing protein n=1 Tax=Clostridium sp. TaxID=1506 RepID=UPI003D6CB0BD
MLVEQIYDNTMLYISSVPKNNRKKIGQFFTPPSVATFMGSLVEYTKKEITILDAGAGSGILSSAICDEVLKNPNIESLHIDLYENNDDILPILNQNLECMVNTLKCNGKILTYKVLSENFIIYNTGYWRGDIGATSPLYDVVISNPPYKKIRKQDLEALAMLDIVFGQPNIYFLFMAMSAKLLKEEGQMIFITPRSFSSGAYFQNFRKWFFHNIKLTNLHLFVSRNDVFSCDSILQETIITKAIKTEKVLKNITITESPNMSIFNNLTTFIVPYDLIVDTNDKNCFMRIPTNEDDINTISFINQWHHNLLTLGYKLKTGPVVDFRSTEFTRYEPSENTVPLFWAYNYGHNNAIAFPIKDNKKPQYIEKSKESLGQLVKNTDYIFVKRFSSKEEPRRIQPVIYNSNEFNFDYIGIENHINYIVKTNDEMNESEQYGLFTILNSTFIDKYFRILNGSTQVNANEMNVIPFPTIEDICEIGAKAIRLKNLTTEECDKIITAKFNKKIKKEEIQEVHKWGN